jgi:hypothetical protein
MQDIIELHVFQLVLQLYLSLGGEGIPLVFIYVGCLKFCFVGWLCFCRGTDVNNQSTKH